MTFALFFSISQVYSLEAHSAIYLSPIANNTDPEPVFRS